MDGRESRVKDCLQQSEIKFEIVKIVNVARSCLDHNHTNSYDLSHLRQFQQSNTFVAKGKSGSECKEASLYLRVDLN